MNTAGSVTPKLHWRNTIFISLIVSIVTACASAPSAASRREDIARRPARINHLVFFKLKNSADADELIRDCDTMIATIPGVVSYFAGKHLDTHRTNVDSNYDVGCYAGFMTEVAYGNYLQHSNHVAAVNKWKPRSEWIRIEDVLDETR